MLPFSINFALIAITAVVSIGAFQNPHFISKFIFYPKMVESRREYWRFITHGFIHADWMHLLMNMFTLYFFGRVIENEFMGLYGNAYAYPFFYLTALVVSSLPAFFKHRNDYTYRSLGASGAVSAVIFACILFEPWLPIYIYFIKIPGILFAVGYTLYSRYMSDKGMDNIGHEAHLHGALFGLAFPLVTKPHLIQAFIEKLMHPYF